MSGAWWRSASASRCWRRCTRAGAPRAPIRWKRCAMVDAPPLRLERVQRIYRTEGGELAVLRDVDLTLRPGEIVALVAPSGAGKSTLLHVAGLLDQPDRGRVLVDGRDAGSLSDKERTEIRRDSIGF